MKESAHTFGSQVPIFGVMTEPAADIVHKDHPTVLLVNAGLLGRIGPFRLHVILARELARMGFRTLRLDLSGIGDSGRHRDNRPRVEQHLNDIRDAMDYLEKERGATKFIVMGICTGADNAHRALREDNRVVGAVCVDGYSYPTWRYYANHYLPKFISRTSWRNLLKRAMNKFSSSESTESDSADDDELDYRWKLPPKEQAESDYRHFIGRDARLMCVYTAGWRCNYSRQLADAFRKLDFGNSISAVYLPNATHIFKVEEDRESLIGAIKPWLRSNWGADKRMS
jgi:pimeloyl-ACP methyl ester carboxylesterase